MVTQEEIKEEIIKKSKNLAIPTDKLDFHEYHDTARAVDIIQVYFRYQALGSSNGKKFAFEFPFDNTNKKDMLLLEIERGLRSMEKSFINSDSCNRISYNGQYFTYESRMQNKGTRVSITCTNCGKNFTSNLVDEEARFENFDLILMYMLADSYCRCDCDKSMYSSANTNNSITTTANIDPSVKEGERIPRIN